MNYTTHPSASIKAQIKAQAFFTATILALILLSVGTKEAVAATDTTWTDSSGDKTWTNSSNWTAGAPVGGFNAHFAGNTAGDPNQFYALTMDKITFDAGGTTHTPAFGATGGWNVNAAGTFIEVQSGNTAAQALSASRNNGQPVVLPAGASTILNNGSGGLTVGSTIAAGGGALKCANNANSTLVVDGSGTTTIGGFSGGTFVLANNGSGVLSLAKSGGGTLILSGSNSYTGGTVISNGMIKIGSATALGSSNALVVVNSGAVLDLSGTVMTNSTTYPVTLNGSGLGGGGALINGGATAATFFGSIALGSDSSIKAASANLTLGSSGSSVPITGGYGLTLGGGSQVDIFGNIQAASVTKVDGGVLRLEPANSFAGGLTIQNGSVVAKNAGSLGAGTVYLLDTAGSSSAFLELGVGNSVFNNPLIVQAGSTGTATLDNYLNYSPTWAGSIILSNSLTLKGSSGQTLTVSGSISGSGDLITASYDTNCNISLTGTNTYSGTTYVGIGNLALAGSGSISKSPLISIVAGATLDVSAAGITLTGSSPQQTLASSSTNGAANINAPSQTVTLNSSALLSFQAVGGSASMLGKISLVGSAANLALNNNAITVNVTGAALAAGTYRLLDCTGTLTGMANSRPAITGTVLANGYTATVTTTIGAGGHVDLVVNATPSFSGLTASPGITYGATSATLSGTVSSVTGPTTVYAANGDTVTAIINGQAVNGTVSGSNGGFTINYNDASLATLGVGGSPYTITYAYGGSATANLNAAANDTSTSLTVVKATPTATLGVNNSPETYNGSAQPAMVLINASSVPGNVDDVKYDGSATAPVGAGTYVVTADFIPNDAADYNMLSGLSAGTFVINRAASTITLTGSTFTYNGAIQTPTISIAGSTSVSTTNYTGTGYAKASAPTNAGSYTLTVSVLGNANYNGATNSQAFNINAAALTVTANSTNKIYDGIPFSGGSGVTYMGFVNGETNTVLSGALAYGGSAQGATNVGMYTIIPSGLNATNYSISYLNGTLTINTNVFVGNWAWSTLPSSVNWNANNWTSGTTPGVEIGRPANGSALFFGGSSQLNPNNDLVGGSFSGITFNSGANAFTISGNAFALSGGITNISSSLEAFTNDIILASNIFIANVGGGSIYLGGVVSGAEGLVLAGGGTLILSGSNSYTGGTVISNGMIKIGSATALGSSNALVVVNSGAVLDLSGTVMTNSTTYPVTLNGSGLGGGGALINGGATAATFFGSIALGSDSSIKAASANLTLGSSGSSVPITGGYGLTLGGGSQVDIFGNIQAANVTEVDGGVLRLESANSFAGGLTIQNGSVVAKNAGSLGAGTVYLLDTAGSSSAFLELGVDNSVFNNPLIVQAGSTGTARIDNYGGAYSPIWAGPITLNNGLTLQSQGAAPTGFLTVSGPIGGSGALTIGNSYAADTVKLSGTNTYSGATYVMAGTLALTGGGSISNTPVISLAGGTTFDVSGLSSSYVLQPGQTISNSSATTVMLNGNIDASQGIIAMTASGAGPIFTITNGTLLLSTNTILQIDNNIGAPGTYPVITTSVGGSVSGTAPTHTFPFAHATGAFLITNGALDIIAITNYAASDYYISPTGNDLTGDGTFANPWQSLAKARDTLEGLALTNNVNVNLLGGRYELTNTITFTAADSGIGYYITYRAYPGETPTISGGKQVTGWTQVPSQPYWVANVPTNAGFADYFRQLYVNGVRAERARSDWIPAANFLLDPSDTNICNGVQFTTNSGIKTYSNLSDVRLLHIFSFKTDEFPITGISTNSVSGLIEVTLQQPYCQTRYDYEGGPPANETWRGTDSWMVVSAFEELDEPGEWYLNRATHQVFYYPYSYENMSNALVYAPVVETLVSLNGDSPSNKVQNIRFQGITFEHGNWFFPRDYYIGGCQAELLYNAAPTNGSIGYNYQVPGEIMLNNTLGIQFLGNTIQHQGACGIHAYDGARDTLIQGNMFYDLTGAAVLGGHWNNINELCTNTVVEDNVIRDIGMDFMAGTLVDDLAHNGFQVLHNDMADAQYAGFHERNNVALLPTGQGNIVVASNRIALVMSGARYDVCDGGSIYSFGVFPNSVVTANDIYDINQPGGIDEPVRGLYQDEFSYGWTWSSNVIRSVLPGLTGCYWGGKNTNYPLINVAIGNFTDATVLYTNGLASNISYCNFTLGQIPDPAKPIIAAAGLEPAYNNLLSRIYSGTNLALGKYTWASSQWATGYEPTNAVNWNYSNYWRSASNDTNGWWAVDLGSPYVLQRLEIAPRIDLDDPTARQDFQVQGANNSNFVGYVVLSEQNDTPFAYKAPNLRNSWIKYLNNPNGYRYLRVQKTSGWNLSISQFQVYGYQMFADAGQLVWDAGATGGVTDGSGEWNAPNRWWNGNGNQAWADYSDAVIGNSNGAAGLVTVTGTSPILNSLTFNPASSGTYILSGNTLQLAGTNATTFTANADAIVTNNLDAAGAFLKNGTATLNLAGSNTFVGDLTINAGTLKVSQINALGSTNRAIVSVGAALDINGQSLNNGAKAIVVGGAGVGGDGALLNTGASQGTAFSNLVMTADTTIGTASQITLRNSYSTPGLGLDMGGHTLTKIGSGVLSLTTAASGCLMNPGNFVVNAGTLQFGFSFPNEALAPGESNYTVTVNGGATLDIYKSSANMTYNLVMQDGSTLSFSGYSNTGSMSGPMTLGGAVTMLMNTNGVYQGAIAGAGSLLKTGTGTLTLTGTNDYVGNTTVSSGALVIQQPGLSASAFVTVASGAKLQLNFNGTNQVGGLSFNGTNQSTGVHNSTTDPAFLAGPGSLLVTASSQFAISPVLKNQAAPMNLSCGIKNGILTLSWPSNYSGWILQFQTNPLNVGLVSLSNGWLDLPGSAGVNSTNISIDTHIPSGFYRLRQP